MRRRYSGIAITVVTLASAMPMQAQLPGAHVEDIIILRSLRLSRITPTPFCAAARTGFVPVAAEDRYDFKAVATDATTGEVISANGARAGGLHACFGPTGDSLTANFYAEGDVGGATLVGRGQCRTTKRDFPEIGILLLTCQLDLSGLPAPFVGGQLTTNTISSRARMSPKAS